MNATLAPSFAFLTVAVTVNFLSNSTVVDEALTEIDGSDGLAVGLAGVNDCSVSLPFEFRLLHDLQVELQLLYLNYKVNMTIHLQRLPLM